MDVRDADGSNVIHQIMAKRMSEIDMESRTEVVKNQKAPQQAELIAQKEVAVTKAETEQISGEAQAKSEKQTAEQKMEVGKIKQVKRAEIDKESAIISAEKFKQQTQIEAEANKYKVETDAAAELERRKKIAEGEMAIGKAQSEVTLVQGESATEAKKLLELAGVTAQTTLTKEIGENKSYQEYLIKIREVEVSQVVGVAQYESIATALSKAELKLLVNSGDVHSGIGSFADLFTAKGGSQLNGLIEDLKQTDEGKKLLSVIDKLTPKSE